MLNILVTPPRPLNRGHCVGEIHLSHFPPKAIFDRLASDAINALPKDAYTRCIIHDVANETEANEFVKDYIGEFWICWCDG